MMDTAPYNPANINEARDGFRMAKPQKAFAVAFAVLTAALAGCASGLGSSAYDVSAAAPVAQVEEGTIVAVRPAAVADNGRLALSGSSYTVRLPSGELVSIAQSGEYAIPSGTPVLVEYGAQSRVIPQNLT